MTILRENEHHKLSWDKSKKLLIVQRFNSPKLTDDIYKKELIYIANFTEKYLPTYILMDNQLFTFSISPELQTWVNQTIFTRLLKTPLLKGAFLVSSDFFTQLSIEQTFEEILGQKFTIRYFEGKKEAMDWLIN